MCIELRIAGTKPRCAVFIGSQGRFCYSLIRHPSVKLWHLSLVVKLATALLCTEDLRKSLLITRQLPVRQIVVLFLTGPCFCVVSQPLLCAGYSIFHFTTRHIRLWPSVCVCVCVCVYTRVCMLYICLHSSAYTYTNICINWCVCVRACVLAGMNEWMNETRWISERMSERTRFYTIFITNLLHSVFICYYLVLWHTSTIILGHFQRS